MHQIKDKEVEKHSNKSILDDLFPEEKNKINFSFLSPVLPKFKVEISWEIT